MRFVVHEMSHVVQHRAQFQRQPRVRPHFMDRAQLIEKRKRQPRHLLGMLGVVIQPPRKPARAGQQFLGAAFFLRRGSSAGILFGDQIEQQPFAHAHSGHQHRAQAEPFRHRRNNDRGDSHHFRAIFSHAKRAHAPGNVQTHQSPGLILQQPHIDRRRSAHQRARRQPHQRLGVSAARHADRARKVRRRWHRASQQGQNVVPQPPRGVFVNRAVNGICFHQPDGAQRKRDAMPQRAALDKNSAPGCRRRDRKSAAAARGRPAPSAPPSKPAALLPRC